MQIDELERLQQHPFLKGANGQAWQILKDKGRWINAHKGQTLVSYEEPSSDVFFVIEGALEAEVFTDAGKPVFFREIASGEVFGELSAIDKATRAATVLALTDCALVVLPASEFEAIMRADYTIAHRFMALLAQKVRDMSEQLYELRALDVPTRVMAELLRMSDKNDQQHDNQAILTPSPTHEAIATRVGTSRELVTRALSKLSAEGLIEKGKGSIKILDLKAMALLVQH